MAAERETRRPTRSQIRGSSKLIQDGASRSTSPHSSPPRRSTGEQTRKSPSAACKHQEKAPPTAKKKEVGEGSASYRSSPAPWIWRSIGIGATTIHESFFHLVALNRDSGEKKWIRERGGSGSRCSFIGHGGEKEEQTYNYTRTRPPLPLRPATPVEERGRGAAGIHGTRPTLLTGSQRERGREKNPTDDPVGVLACESAVQCVSFTTTCVGRVK